MIGLQVASSFLRKSSHSISTTPSFSVDTWSNAAAPSSSYIPETSSTGVKRDASGNAICEDTLFEFATEGEKGMMMKNKKSPDQILKPVRSNEFTFYETVYPNCPQIQRFAPKYFGFKMKERPIVKLEDLTKPYSRASIMDIKMGVSTAGESDTDEKKEYRLKKDGATTSLSLGMRFAGLWIFDPESRQYVVKDKSWGKKLESKDFYSTLDLFISNQGANTIQKRIELLDKWLEQLSQIREWIEGPQAQFRMYSSSLLFIYEGDSTVDCKCDLRMIDFSHVYPIRDGGRDEGYLKGLRNLQTYLEDLRDMYILSMGS